MLGSSLMTSFFFFLFLIITRRNLVWGFKSSPPPPLYDRLFLWWSRTKLYHGAFYRQHQTKVFIASCCILVRPVSITVSITAIHFWHFPFKHPLSFLRILPQKKIQANNVSVAYRSPSQSRALWWDTRDTVDHQPHLEGWPHLVSSGKAAGPQPPSVHVALWHSNI